MAITNRGKFRILRALARDDAWPASFYVALVTDTPTPNTKTFSELTEIATGNGYTGPIQITRDATGFPSVVESDADNLAYSEIKNIAIQAAGGPIPSSGQPITYVVFTDDNATPADREVWAYSSLTQGSLLVGETLTIDDWRLMLLEGILLVSGIEDIQNIGTAGFGLFKQLLGKVAQFKNINAGSSKITITDDLANNEVDVDVDESQVNHNSLLNYVLNQHRALNDAGSSAIELWSADKIASEIAASGGGSDFISVIDEKAANTAGGTFTSGAWRTRDLTSEKADAGGHASLSSNQITLAAGTYRALIFAPGHNVGVHKAKLYNITDAVDVLIGSSERGTPNNTFYVTQSIISGIFTIASAKVLEVQHRCTTTVATNGFGIASNFAVAEVYTQVMLWKES